MCRVIWIFYNTDTTKVFERVFKTKVPDGSICCLKCDGKLEFITKLEELDNYKLSSKVENEIVKLFAKT